jgi:preprotein translocase subunit SecG
MSRLFATLSYSMLLLSTLSCTALASNDGRGFYGATDDKVITDAGFILIVFFPLFVLILSLIQGRLEKRREARKAAHKKAGLGNGQWRGGW